MVKRLTLLLVFLVVLVLAAGTAWQLWPVQIMILAYRFTHPVEANRAVHWQEGPARPPAGMPLVKDAGLKS